MVVIAAAGDIMTGDHPVCFGHGIRSVIRKKGLRFLVSEIEPWLQKADICFGNLEAVLADEKPGEEKSLSASELRGDARTAGLLAEAGFTLLNLANNHILQHGMAAFDETIAGLGAAGISCIGLQEGRGSNVHLVDQNGIRLAFVGYSLRPEKFLNTRQGGYARCSHQEVLRQVAGLRSARPEAKIIVSLHWGEEYLNYPSSEQIDFAHELIDAGALVILGHHPHVLQGVETYRSGLICYSLGNLIFDKWQRNSRQSMLVRITVGPDGIAGYQLVPVYIRKNYSLCLGCERANRKILARLAEYSDAVAQRSAKIAGGRKYDQQARAAYFRFRISSYLYFIFHLWRYPPRILAQSLGRSIRRRLGKE